MEKDVRREAISKRKGVAIVKTIDLKSSDVIKLRKRNPSSDD